MTAVYQEARYLKALCHSRQGDLEDALRTLLPLRGRRLDGELPELVNDLRAGIRGVLTPNAIITFLLSFPSEPAPAEARLRDAISLDPEAGDLYFVLAGALASRGDLEEALEVTEQGLQNVAGDGQRLRAMSEQIKRQLVRPKLSSAVAAFKEESYRQAQQELRGVSAGWRQIPVVEDFEEYLGQLVRRRKTARGLPPTGPFDRIDALYFLLAGDEIASAKESIAREDYAGAERVLERGMSFAPHFPYLNFLYALSVYHLVGEWLGDPHDVDFDGPLERLQRAARSAEVAATDHEIEQARALGEAIAGLHAFISEAGERRQANEREARVVNAAIEEFRSIMESAQGGLGGPEGLAGLKRRLVELRESIPDLQRAAVTAEGKAAVQQLDEVVRSNLADLGQATAVQQCFEKFEQVMAGVKDGIESEAQLQELQQRLGELRGQIATARDDVKDKNARRSLEQLAKTVDGHLKQLQKSAPAAAVSTLVAEFNAIMESLEGGIENEKQLADVRKRFSTLRAKVAGARSDAKDKGARRALDQLLEAVDSHLEQLDKAMAGPRIEQLVKAFNWFVEGLNAGGPLSPREAKEKRDALEALRELARAERKQVSNSQARATLDELESAATQVIKALGG